MKIIEKQNLVKVEGDVEVKKFGFLFNAKMVGLLSDSLYQDKILALVRELSTNGLDSQTENGNSDKPLDVHLPTWNDPHFSIRDYGVGMSPERVDLIYRHYGGSDRTESNDFVGGMGLGSKTPFCYNSKTFTIDSWHNGIHYCYSAYIGEDGIPCIAKMSEGPSTEPSGVKIKLPTARHDESNFAHAAQKVYSYFPVKPVIHGNAISISTIQYTLIGNDGDWKLRKNDGNGLRVIMGNVAYPVKYADANITSAQQNVINSSFDIFADIGSLSVDIGREGLSYDNRTKTRVRYYINKIITDFNAKIQEEVDKSVNLWEARKKFTELYNSSEVRVMDGSKIEYGGIKLFDTNSHNVVMLDSFIKSGELELISITHDGYRCSKYVKRKINSIHTKQVGHFYTNDLAVGSFVRAADIAKTDGVQVILFSFENDAVRQQIIDFIGCDSTYFTPISSVPSPTVRKSGVSRGNIARVVSFDTTRGHHCEAMNSFWSNEKDADINVGGLYVEFNRYSYKDGASIRKPQSLAKIISQCKTAGITVPQIFGIKTADIRRIIGNPKWTNFNTWIANEVTTLLSSTNLDEVQFYQKQLSLIGKNVYDSGGRYCKKLSAEHILKIAQYCTVKGAFTAFAEIVKHASSLVKKSATLFALRDLATMLGVKIPDNSQGLPQISFDKMETEVYNRYVVLGILDFGYSGLSNKEFTGLGKYVDSFS